MSGPNDGTGRTWHEYFNDFRAKWEAEHAVEQEEEDEAGVPVVTIPIRDASEAEVDGCAIANVRKLAEAGGFETRLGYCRAFIEGSVFKSGEREGQKRDDKYVDTLVLIGRRAGRGSFRLTYNRTNGGKWTRYYAQINGELRTVGDKELREWLKG